MLDSAIYYTPMNATAWRERSVFYTKTGDYARAYEALDRAVEIDPRDALGYRGWLKLYKTHNYRGAIDDLTAFQALHQETAYPWGENIYYLMGTAFLGLEDYDSAIINLSRCIDEVTAESGEKWVDVYAWVNRGIAYTQSGQFSAAQTDFAKALEHYPQCAEAFFFSALAYFEADQYDLGCEALANCKRYFDQGYAKGDPYKDFNFQLYAGQIEDVAEANDCDL